MPHDRKGRELEVGDFVHAQPLNHSNTPVVGRVIQIKAGAQACSGKIGWYGIGVKHEDYFDAGDSLLICKCNGELVDEIEPAEPLTNS